MITKKKVNSDNSLQDLMLLPAIVLPAGMPLDVMQFGR